MKGATAAWYSASSPFVTCPVSEMTRSGWVIVMPSSTRPFAADFADGAAAGTLLTGLGFSIFHLGGFLVLPQALEGRMADMAVFGPFGEGDFAEQVPA